MPQMPPSGNIDDTAELPVESCDVVVIGSGSAALTAALATAVAGLKTIILEKTDRIGGTSAMSGAGTWIPANHHARAAGIDDSPEEALAYIRAAAPAGWQETEDALWRSAVAAAPAMLAFVEARSPLRFALADDPDPRLDLPGARARGRMVSPLPLRRALLGPLARKLRPSTLPQIYTYQEVHALDVYHHPIRAGLKMAPVLAWRWLTGQRAKGAALIVGLLRGALDAGARIELSARARELATDPATGAVTGVVYEQDGRLHHLQAGKGIVIASGGFEWDPTLRERHFPGPWDYIASPRGNEGDGHRMAAAAGAALAHMDQGNVNPAMPTRYDGRLHGLGLFFHREANAILVDRNGHRFADEFAFNIGEIVDRRDPVTGLPLHLPAWLITDSNFLRRAPIVRLYARHDPRWLVRAPTIEALADLIRLPAPTLAATVARFNGFCAAGHDADFGRGVRSAEDPKRATGEPALAPIRRAPFYAMPFNRSFLATKGGPRTDQAGRVRRPDGTVIQGLYCAGVAMANPIGTRAVGAGTTIGPNMTWGFICAQDIAARAGVTLPGTEATSAPRAPEPDKAQKEPMR